ncbi:MAG TPA: two-component regulator propeller domain-containing protein [Chthoniobacterales bacterium]|nr:two-component regulator propeller domain-containing protein [Chthoniobacterales bacterium]
MIATLKMLADLGLERSSKAERGLIVWAAIIVFFALVTLYRWRRTRSAAGHPGDTDIAPQRGAPFMKKTFLAVIQIACGILVVYAIAKFTEPKPTRPAGWQLISPPHEVTVVAQQGGRIWAGGREGLFVVDMNTRQLVNIPEIQSRDLRAVRALLGEDKQVSIGCRAGLLQYDGSHLQTLLPPGRNDLGPVTALYRSRDDFLWIGVGNGAWRVDRGLGNWRWFGPNEGLILPSVDVIYQTRDGDLWFASNAPEAVGLFRYQNQTAKFSDAGSGLRHHAVNDFLEDHGGKLWVATGFGSRGAVVFLEEGRWREVADLPDISGEKIRSLFEDSRRQIWICSEYNGVAIRAGGAWRRLTTREGLPGMEVKDMLEDANGALWLGTERGLGFLNTVP